jgi:hypothetical protein
MSWKASSGAAEKQIKVTGEMPMRPAQLAGSHVKGTVQVTETAINDIVHVFAGESGPAIELLPHNGLMLRYGMFHARAELPSHLGQDTLPRVTLVLASVLVAWGLKAFVHQPFLHVHGRHLTVDLAAMPALDAWRDLWRHLHQLTFETAPGALRVGFVIEVEQDDARMV